MDLLDSASEPFSLQLVAQLVVIAHFELLGLSTGTVLDRFERGELPGFRLGGRVGAPVCFRWSEVEAWLELGRRGPVVAVDRVEV